MIAIPAEVQARFWAKVNKTEGCWLWTGSRNAKGYGQFNWRKLGRPHLAHRFLLLMQGIPVPAGMMVLHECDNPACVNPAHLRLGTAAENSQDMVQKNRSSRGERHCHAKLTLADVLLIRQLHTTYQHTQQELAALFGVARTTISSIVTGRNWKTWE
jgi:DNA-binding XRE family transcriptional regulator